MDAAELTVGAKVAEYQNGNPATVRQVTVTKLTPKQVVLSNGHRYWLADLSEVGESSRHAWSSRRYLLAPTDPRAVQAAAEEAVRDLIHAVSQIGRNFGSDSRTPLLVLEQIERFTAQTRRALVGEEAAP